jgi:hypothetical protein
MYLQEPVLNGLFCLEWLSVVPLRIFDTNTLGVNELVCEANHKIDKIIDQLESHTLFMATELPFFEVKINNCRKETIFGGCQTRVT